MNITVCAKRLFLPYKQNKKYFSSDLKKFCGTWREPKEHDTQIGQLLYYLTAEQFRRLQMHFTPNARHQYPTLVLGLYMEDGVV